MSIAVADVTFWLMVTPPKDVFFDIEHIIEFTIGFMKSNKIVDICAYKFGTQRYWIRARKPNEYAR